MRQWGNESMEAGMTFSPLTWGVPYPIEKLPWSPVSGITADLAAGLEPFGGAQSRPAAGSGVWVLSTPRPRNRSLAGPNAERIILFWRAPPQYCLFEKFQNPADTWLDIANAPGTDPNAQPADHPPSPQGGAARHKKAWPCQQTPRQRRPVPTPSQRPARRQARHAPGRRPAIRVAAHAPAPHAVGRTNDWQAGPISAPIRTVAASRADDHLPAPAERSTPLSWAMPRPLHPAPVPTSCPRSSPTLCARVGLRLGLHAAAACPDCKALHADCPVQHRTPPSIEA